MQLPARVLAGVLLACATGNSQSGVFGDFNPLSSRSSGVHLYGVSVSGAYFSGGYGLGLPTLMPGNTSNVGMVQGSAVFGWSSQGTNSNASIVYSPSYVRGINVSDYRSLNHSLSMSGSRKLNSKWDLTAAGNGVITDFSQLLFARSRPASMVSLASSFDDLFAAITTGRSTDALLTQTVTAAGSLRNTPETAFLYGGRLLTAGASIATSYAASLRSSFHFGVNASRAQQYRGGSNIESYSAGLIPKTTGGTANVGWSFSINSRTTISVDATSGRTFSTLQDAWTHQVNFSFGRTLNRHWFVHGSGGAGTIRAVRDVFGPTRQIQPQFGGGVGYKVYSHAFLAAFTRAISDVYGLGANTMDTSSAGWTWKRPGSTYSVSASAGYSRLNGPAFRNSETWTTNAAVGKALSRHVALSIGASHASLPSTLVTTRPDTKQTGVVVSLSWSPSERR